MNIIQSNFENMHSEQERIRADVNGDGIIDELDYSILESEVNGTTSRLRNLKLNFILGWYDVDTEGLFEDDFNLSGNISEVSK